MARSIDHRREYTRAGPVGPDLRWNLVSWSAVFAGTVIAIATFGLLVLLWQAAGFASDVDFIADNIEWFVGASGIFTMFLGGMLAAWIARTFGLTQGVLHGLTVWGLLTLAAVTFAAPLANLQGVDAVDELTDSQRWTAFWSLLIGFGAAVLGGIFGGLLPHPPGGRSRMDEPDERRVVEEDRDEDVVVDEHGEVISRH